MVPKAIDWTSFTRRIRIKSNLSHVYAHWAKPQLLEKWFLKKANYFRNENPINPIELVQKGDEYHWTWHNWDTVEKGQILNAIENEFIQFQFGSDAGHVRIDFKEISPNYIEIILYQNGIPEDDISRYNLFYGCSLGWSFWLTNLKAFIEHGILLNDTNLKSDHLMQFVNS